MVLDYNFHRLAKESPELCYILEESLACLLSLNCALGRNVFYAVCKVDSCFDQTQSGLCCVSACLWTSLIP